MFTLKNQNKLIFNQQIFALEISHPIIKYQKEKFQGFSL